MASLLLVHRCFRYQHVELFVELRRFVKTMLESPAAICFGSIYLASSALTFICYDSPQKAEPRCG